MSAGSADRIPFTRITAQPVNPAAREFMVRMRDGVRLATDVYLPGGDPDPGPTILTRLPYDKNGDYTFISTVAKYIVERGYRFVAQDVRGKFRSEGETLLFVNEAYDGYDTIEWIVNQPWSDGIVGMWGESYYGYTQLAAASTGHPALRAITPRMTGTRLGDLARPLDGSGTAEVEMGVHRVYPLTHFQSNDTYEWEMDWRRRPYAEAVERWFATVGERSPSYDLWMPHEVPLRRFPAGHPFDAPPVPMLQTIGWWDNCAPWQWQDHELIASRPAWARNEYLLIEAIDHEGYHLSQVPYDETSDHAVNAAARLAMLPRYLDPALQFFDVFLCGSGTPGDLPRVRWQVAGEPGFRESPTWPPSDTTPAELYLGDGTLSPQPIGGARELRWTHDPGDPVPSPVQNAFAFLSEYPDERELASRRDVLSFDASPVTGPLILAGPVELRVTPASSGPEMDIFARLTDVAPDGSAHMIARGQRTVDDPWDPRMVEVPMGQVGYRLNEGHALRLTLASSDSPEFVPAPGTGQHRWLASETQPNEQRVVVGGSTESVLRLPLLTG